VKLGRPSDGLVGLVTSESPICTPGLGDPVSPDGLVSPFSLDCVCGPTNHFIAIGF